MAPSSQRELSSERTTLHGHDDDDDDDNSNNTDLLFPKPNATEVTPLLSAGGALISPDADLDALQDHTLIGVVKSIIGYGGASSSTSTSRDRPKTADGDTDALLSGNGNSNSNSNSNNDDNDDDDPDRPVPLLQLFLLCYVRVMEPVAFFSIFPFIAQMVQRNGSLPSSDVGFYSGLIESVFSAVQVVVLIFWGRLADRVGRKPTLVVSLIGMSLGIVFFNLASSIPQMILFRCFAGVFSGSALIIRTMVGDISTTKTQAMAFSWFAFAGNVGIFLGPIIGGFLADPVTQYPSVFGGNAFLTKYPYALPGFVCGGLTLSAALTSALFLEETLTPGSKHADAATTTTTTTTSAPPTKQVDYTMRELIKAPGVVIVIVIYSWVLLLAFAFTALLPVVLFTPVNLGGIGFSSFLISLYMAAQGFSQALWLILIFPFLHRRIGTKRVLRLCGLGYPAFFIGYIIMNSCLRNGSEPARVWFWIIGGTICFIGPGVSMAYTGIQLALNDVAPSPRTLGTLNAMAMTVASAIRSFVPGVTTAVFAIGVRNQILGGHLVWAILIPIAAALVVAMNWLPEDKEVPKRQTD